MSMEKNLVELGDQASESGNAELAVKYYLQAAEAGDTDGMCNVGLSYQYGEGVEQSAEKAMEWYRKILEAGDPDGWYLMGTVYDDLEEYDKAADCYEKQLEEGGNGVYFAMYSLARAYQYGRGREENFPLALDYYHQAAGHGDVQAMVALGEMYFSGQGVTEDYDIANYWFEKAADSDGGNPEAFEHMGLAYYFGWGRDVDYDRSMEYFEKALEAGNEDVLYSIGRIYYDRENYGTALEYFQRAAVDGNELQAYAEDKLGDMYRCGEGVRQNLDEAVKWYEKGAEHENEESMASLGYIYAKEEEMKDEARSAYWNLQAAKEGNVVAMFNTGYHYANGIGVEQDYVAAMAWYKKAAEAGEEDSMEELGDLYYFGNGVAKDYTLAKEWYEKAIMAGNETPLMPLGTIYYYRQDYKKAMEFYLKAANDDNKYQHIAEARIGDLYMEGAGVEQDLSKTVEWYKKSAGHCYANAMRILGDLYAEGNGVAQDMAKAREWYRKALETGVDDEEAAEIKMKLDSFD